jgi:tetratricopeptide (TPR) repeat protein
MGRKRAGERKQIRFCFAVLIVLCLSACTFSKMIETKIIGSTRFNAADREAREHLVLGRSFFAQGDYGSALKENEKALSLAGNISPADEALFFIGLISVYPANPSKDYGKSVLSFKKLIKDHPKSPLVEEAKAIVGILQENDKLNRTIDQLNTVIEELKKVDIRVEQKKREKAK